VFGETETNKVIVLNILRCPVESRGLGMDVCWFRVFDPGAQAEDRMEVKNF
jgi:hypothetical protein